MRVVMGSRSTPPAATASSEQSSRVLDIKKESPDDEIKEYAETAMNELLGWYGYDKLDSRDTQGLNLHHFAAQRSPSDLDSSDAEGARSSSSPVRRDAGTGSSQESPPLPDPASVPAGCTVCAWCQKVAKNKQLFSLKTPTGQKAFCSEVCFTQCRRASFKRNKTCDWCRHVRHTVNYVDFQDGEHQLQFCSDKCLNQYKMNIFCKETQAHLQMHPHLQEGAASGGSGLITPELWLRDCRSDDLADDSPLSDRSLSPPPASVSSSASAPSAASRAVSSPPLPAPPPPPPELPPQPSEHKESSVKMRRAGRLNRRGTRAPVTATVTSVTAADLRTTSSSSPRSAGSISPPKHNHIPHLHPLPPPSAQIPPILHPPPHMLPPDPHLPRHGPPPFIPPGLLPPPHLFSDPHQHPHLNPARFPAALLRPPRTSSSSPPPPLHPPPLLPIPHLQPRSPRGPPLHHPPPQPPSRFLLPPVTVMVPYPIVIPIPLPIPIPIPLFPPRNSKSSAEETTTTMTTTTTTVTSSTKPSATTAAVVAPSRCKEDSAVEPPATAPPASPPLVPSPLQADAKLKPSLAPSRPSVSDRPLRKRKRLDVSAEDENLGKRKFVPV